MKRAMKGSVALVAGLAGTVFLVLGLLWVKPESFVGERALSLLRERLHAAGIGLTWSHFRLQIEKPHWGLRRIELSLLDARLQVADLGVEADLRRLVVSAEVGWRKWVPFFSLKRMEANARMVSVDLRRSKESNETIPADRKSPAIPSVLHGATLGVWVEKFVVLDDSGSAMGRGEITGDVDAGEMRLATSGECAESRTGKWIWHGSGTWDLSGASPFRLSIGHANAGYSLSSRFEGDLTASSIKAEIFGEIKFASRRPLREVRVRHCRVEVTNREAGIDHIGSDCVLQAQFSALGSYAKTLAPKEVTARVNASAQIGDPANRRGIKTEIRVRVDAAESRLLRGAGWLHAKSQGDLAQFPLGLRWNTEVDFDLQIQEFQSLVALAGEGLFVIPRPFSVMKGAVTLKTSGSVDIEKERIQAPILLSTALHSPSQRFFSKTEGTVTVSWGGSQPEISLNAAVALSDVRLIAPPVDVVKPLKILPDSRFIASAKGQKTDGKAKGVKFDYDLRIKSLARTPVRVVIKKPEALVPVVLDLYLSSSRAPSGTVELQPFDAKLFRKVARMENLQLTFDSKHRLLKVSGKAKVEHGIYRIYLSFFGTERSIHIDYSSAPPLSKDQIWALLLFGREPNVLSATEAESVVNVRSAVAEGAVNLLTLYALASAPIQSVNYQAATGIVTTGLRVEDGTTVFLGSDFKDQYRVGLQRRLGNHWWWTSDVRSAPGLESPVVSSFIEWVTRY